MYEDRGSPQTIPRIPPSRDKITRRTGSLTRVDQDPVPILPKQETRVRASPLVTASHWPAISVSESLITDPLSRESARFVCPVQTWEGDAPLSRYLPPQGPFVLQYRRFRSPLLSLPILIQPSLCIDHSNLSPDPITSMAIHPRLRPAASQASLSPQQTLAISAWTEQAAASLQDLTLSESTTTFRADTAATPSRSSLRGTTVSLTIPVDDQTPTVTSQVKVVASGESRPPTVSFRRREPLSRDTLKRREALLKGKDGSRRRQRWENGMPRLYPRSHHELNTRS